MNNNKNFFIYIFITLLSILTLFNLTSAFAKNNNQVKKNTSNEATTKNNEHKLKIDKFKIFDNTEVWLYQDKNSQIINTIISFDGGKSQDNKSGSSTLLANLLSEGAGKLNKEQYHQALEDITSYINYSSDYDYFHINVTTLNYNYKKAFALLKSAIEDPILDTKDITRIKKELTSSIKEQEMYPSYQVSKLLRATVFKNHAYSHTLTINEIEQVTRKDILGYLKNNLAKSNMHVVMVGGINKQQAIDILTKTFGNIKNEVTLKKIPYIKIQPQNEIKVTKLDVPQSTIKWVSNGVTDLKDKDYFPLIIANNIIGGDSLTSVLGKKIRVEEGLAYYIHSSFTNYKNAHLITGSSSINNKNVSTAINKIKKTLTETINTKITEEQLNNTKNYLIGTRALSLRTLYSISNTLVNLMLKGNDIEYYYNYNKKIQEVTLDDLNRVMKKYFNPKNISFFVAGNPIL